MLCVVNSSDSRSDARQINARRVYIPIAFPSSALLRSAKFIRAAVCCWAASLLVDAGSRSFHATPLWPPFSLLLGSTHASSCSDRHGLLDRIQEMLFF